VHGLSAEVEWERPKNRKFFGLYRQLRMKEIPLQLPRNGSLHVTRSGSCVNSLVRGAEIQEKKVI
jgi:hypothetical protein